MNKPAFGTRPRGMVTAEIQTRTKRKSLREWFKQLFVDHEVDMLSIRLSNGFQCVDQLRRERSQLLREMCEVRRDITAMTDKHGGNTRLRDMSREVDDLLNFLEHGL